ncbi:MG2 domain-containing protein [Rudaea cellulosilytica]|uniref:MG2 domain-containing protein n=1 Tax=Rudaea cellulosilytica TaxID=540746 RepID=UPI0003612E58|nr:MG2 domain-containing protein [Rudaea cellulosilytica]
MGLLNFIWNLPLMLLRLVGAVLSFFFGNIGWDAPPWARAIASGWDRLGGVVRTRPARSAGILVALVALGLGGLFGYRAWRDRPRPVAEVPATFSVQAPVLTGYDDEARKLIVHPLHVVFNKSVAPLALVGKSPTSGIAMQPELPGAWTWLNDRELNFLPKDDWPVGQKFDVSFDPRTAFAEHVKVDKDRLDFSSAAFKASIVQGEFYQDPQDATAKKAVIHARFSHPVDPASFEKAVALALSGAKLSSTPKKFSVTYDERKVNAFIHSEPLTIPTDDASLAWTVAAGVRAARGGPATDKALSGTVAVPGLYSLQIDGVEATLVDNAKFEPEQVLVVNASQAVSERDVAKAVHAWLLPKYNPKTPEVERGEAAYAWSQDEVGGEVLKAAQKLDLAPIPTEHDYAELASFKYRADPGRYIYVKVDKGLKSFGGYVLGNLVTNIVPVPEYPRMLRFMADGALLSLSGEKRVAVVARNMPGMQLEVGRVLPDQLQHLVSFNQGSYAKPQLYSLNADQITERFVQKLPFGEGDPAKAHFEGVDLGKYFGSGANAKHGVFLLKLGVLKPDEKKAEPDANADEPEAGADQEGEGEASYAEGEAAGTDRVEGDMPEDSRLIVVTDLGMITKKSLDGSYDVYVQSIANGAAVAAANVDVVGKNGQTLVTHTTDAGGHVHFDPLDAMKREKTPAMFVVRKGDDLSFLPLGERDRSLDFSRFDIGGERNAKNAGRLSAYLFSDRGIYRPGDTFHVGVIVRAADWSKPLDGIPLIAEITDARGAVVDTRKLRVETAGFLGVDYTTQESAPTGTWNVNVYIAKDGEADKQIGSVGVQIKEFLPDRMKAEAHLSASSPDGWVKPDGLKALFSLQNLFGTPAQNRRVEATLTLTPSIPSFRAYPDHRFFDPQRAKDGYSDPLGERTTDDKGEAEFPLDLSKYANATYMLRFFAKGYEAEGGRNVAAQASQLVSALDYLVGAKTDGALDFVTRDAKRSVNLIAIDPSAKKIAVGDLKAAIIERRYVSILTKQDSGVYKYESKAKDTTVSEVPLAIAATGNDFALPTDKPGSFALVVRNARGEELNRVDYSVAGEANLTRSLERNAELQLALSKHDYAPGEEVEIAIRAPYAGNGLITIERDKVYAHQWFKAATSGSVQKITVPKDFEGNGYVNVQFVRDPSSDEIFMSPLSYGVVPFSVNRDARRDVTKIDVPSLVKPGDTLRMKASVAQSARIAVFAVDEGILQVARYKLGDPLDFFFRKRMLDVKTSQILDLILPEFSKLVGMAAPGGDADELLARHLNPFKKKRQEPVAWWSGIVDIKDNREFTWTVPEDFNGKLRVMAVAVRADKIGIVQNTTTVRGDFVLSPNLPNMVAPGDEFEVSVGVANNLTGLGGKEVPVKLAFAPSAGIEVVGAAEQTINLGETKEGVVVYKLRAKDALGPAKLDFRASYADKSAKIGSEVSVRPAAAYRTDVAVGDMDKGTAEVKPLRNIYDNFAKREIAASYTPLVLAQGLSAYLDDFQHRCTEQLVSQGVPALVFAAHPEYGALKADKGRKLDDKAGADKLQGLYAVLHTRQNSEGGFGLWASTPVSERFVSVYAMQFLIEAKERGQRVPGDLIDAGNRYLSQLAADESDGSLAGLRERAFAIYLLTRQGTVTTNYIAAVTKRLDDNYGTQAAGAARNTPKDAFFEGNDWHQNLVAGYLAASLKLLKQDKEADRLIAPLQTGLTRATIENAYRFERWYDTLFRDASTLYLLAKHFPERARALPQSALANLVRPIQRGWFNTLSSAQTILALDAYGARTGDGKLSLSEVLKDGTAKPLDASAGVLVRGAFDAAATALRVDNAVDLHAWYAVTQAGFDRAPPTSELKNGLEIVREFTDTDGKAISSATLGQEIDVHLKIRATEADSIGSVAIVDLMPGGFEAVQQPPPAPADDANADNANNAPRPPPPWRSPIGLPGSSWNLSYADVRDDRVVIYGTATRSVSEFIYRIRATNAGSFVVPPAYGESMYDRTVQARSLGTKIEVKKK